MFTSRSGLTPGGSLNRTSNNRGDLALTGVVGDATGETGDSDEGDNTGGLSVCERRQEEEIKRKEGIVCRQRRGKARYTIIQNEPHHHC
jgi:hypothetical protein